MSLPHYTEYKDSSVEWLDEVPRHWSISRLGFETWVRARLGWKGLKAEEYVDEGYAFLSTPNIKGKTIDFDNVNYINELRYEESPEIKIQIGDILLAKDGSTLGTVNVVRNLPIPATVNSSIAVITPRENIDSIFLFYLFQSAFMENTIQRIKGGMGVPHLFQADLNKFYIPLPLLSEQTAIASFLDRETSKIDALVAEQKKLIALLKEKRQAVISCAVTKGLDPTVPMKESGIEWLGAVPEHWEVCLLKRAFRSVDYGISDSLAPEGEVAVLRMGNIDGGKVLISDLKYINSVDPDLLLKEGDLLYNRTNSLDLIGKVGLFTEHGTTPTSFASYLVRLRVQPASDPRYFAYLLNTPAVLAEARSYAFIAIGQCNLNPTRYGQIVVSLPPGTEQREIADHLDLETAKLDALTTEAQRAVALLKERRIALISAAVTGKIEVRELVEKVLPSAELEPA